MLASTRVFREITNLKTGERIKLDFGQSWKIHDCSTLYKTCMFFNGSGSSTKGDRSSPRITWVETDQGGFLCEDESDYKIISGMINLSLDKIRDICKIQPADTVSS